MAGLCHAPLGDETGLGATTTTTAGAGAMRGRGGHLRELGIDSTTRTTVDIA